MALDKRPGVETADGSHDDDGGGCHDDGCHGDPTPVSTGSDLFEGDEYLAFHLLTPCGRLQRHTWQTAITSGAT